MKRLVTILVLSAAVLPAATFTFDLLPGDGAISGAAGSTIGWGYSITNSSSDQWLVTSALNMGPFVSAMPNILFDFPILAPGAVVTQAYDPVAGMGLAELILDNSIILPAVNSGQFELDAQWWNGNPFAGGSFVADASPAMRSYEAIATPSAVPEPSSVALSLLGLGFVATGCMRRR